MLRPKIFCKIGALFEKAGMLLKIAARATSPTAALERTTTATEARIRATTTTKEQLLQQQKLRQQSKYNSKIGTIASTVTTITATTTTTLPLLNSKAEIKDCS